MYFRSNSATGTKLSLITRVVGWLGGWLGGVEERRIKPSQLSTKLKLKLKLIFAIKGEQKKLPKIFKNNSVKFYSNCKNSDTF